MVTEDELLYFVVTVDELLYSVVTVDELLYSVVTEDELLYYVVTADESLYRGRITDQLTCDVLSQRARNTIRKLTFYSYCELLESLIVSVVPGSVDNTIFNSFGNRATLKILA